MTLKDINFNVKMYSTTAITQMDCPIVYTGDESSVQVNFSVTDEPDLTGATAVVHFYFGDSSHIERDLKLIELVFSYTLKGTENDHAGIVRADIIITKSGAKYTRAGYRFRIGTSLEASAPLVEHASDTLDTIMDGAESWLLQAQTDFGVAQNQRAAEWVADNDTRDDQFNAAQTDRTTSFNASEAGRTAAFNTNETGRSNTFTMNENARQAAADANEGIRDGNYSAAEAIRDNQYEVAEANRDAISGIDRTRANEDHARAVIDHATAAGDHEIALTNQGSFEAGQTARQNAYVAAESARDAAFDTTESARATAETGRVTAESNRVTAESGRVTKESQRVTAENNRVTAESNRVTAESGRVTAENARVTAETNRAAAFTTFNTRLTAEETATANNKISTVKGKTFADVDARLEELETQAITVDARTEFEARNLITNGDFSNGVTTGWLGYMASVTNENGKLKVTATAAGPYAQTYMTLSTIVGNKYYIRQTYLPGTVSPSIVNPAISSASSSTFTATQISTQIKYSSGTVVIGDYYYIDDVILINLTATFGSGKEPTLAEMDRLMARFPNSWFDGVKPIQTIETLYQEKANKVQEAWITPTLLNGWTEVSGYPVRYMKDEIGFVHLKGRIASGAIGSYAFTLPVGYKPSELKQYVVPTPTPTAPTRAFISGGSVCPAESTYGAYVDISAIAPFKAEV